MFNKTIWIALIAIFATGCSGRSIDSQKSKPQTLDPKRQAIIELYGENAIFDDEFLILGDHAIPLDEVKLEDVETRGASTLSAVYGDRGRKWPNGIMPIVFKDDEFAEEIWRACRMWELTANVRCVPRNGERAFVEFVVDRSKDYSFATRGYLGRRKHVSSVVSAFSALHEVGHLFGLAHEHQRRDRDEYIRVNMNVVRDDLKYSVRKNNDFRPVGPYDFISVMHYSPNSVRKEGETENAIEPLPQFSQFADYMGFNNLVPSFGDAKSMRDRYGEPQYRMGLRPDNGLRRSCDPDAISGENSRTRHVVEVAFCLVMDRKPDRDEKTKYVEFLEEINQGSINTYLLIFELVTSNEFIQKHDFLFKDHLTKKLILHRVFFRRDALQDDLDQFAEWSLILNEFISDMMASSEWGFQTIPYFRYETPRTDRCPSSMGPFAVCRPDVAQCTRTINSAANKTASIYLAIEDFWSISQIPLRCTSEMIQESPSECGACIVYRHILAFPGRPGYESGAKWLTDKSAFVRTDPLLNNEEALARRFYEIFFNRKPDPEGLSAHSTQMDRMGKEGVKRSIEAFVRSEEFRFD